jgi:hypothetical protein
MAQYSKSNSIIAEPLKKNRPILKRRLGMKKCKIIILLIGLIVCSFNGSAQNTSNEQQFRMSIDINAANFRTFQSQESLNTTVNEIFKDADRFRQFEYNSQLANLRSNNVGDTLLLNFFDDKQYKSVIQRVSINSQGRTNITSKIVESEFAYCYIVVSATTITITAELPLEDEYFFASVKNDQAYIGQMTLTELKKDMIEGSEPQTPSLQNNNLENPSYHGDPLNDGGGINDSVVIDVLVVYTQAAENWALTDAGQTDIHDLITQAIDKANITMENSKTGITFNVVYQYKTNYVEVNSSLDLDRITYNNDGYMDEVHDLRDVFFADVVLFIPSVTFTGGLAWGLNNANGFTNGNLAFALSRVQQSANSYTAVHEIGHNMGCGHHPQQRTESGPLLFNYSAGWKGLVQGRKFCSVMTYESSTEYNEATPNYTRIPYFSSPDTTYNGVIIGDSSTMDNARTLRETKTVTANYRTSPATPTITVSPSALNFTSLPPYSEQFIAISGLNLSGNVNYVLGGADSSAFSVSIIQWDSTKGGILKVAFISTTRQNCQATLTINGNGATSKIIPLTGTSTFCGGTGTTNDPYQICSAEHLKNLADHVNTGNGSNTSGKYYKLMNDIDLTGISNWIPIGTNSTNNANTRFQGNFDGNNNIIQNLIINRPTEDYIGLFGITSNAVITNLGIENCTIIGHNYVGGLVGYNSSTTSNCYVDGNVTGNSNVGGLLGYNTYSISNCYAAGNVTGYDDNIGGLIGYNTTYISRCYTTNNITGNDNIGGLIGYSYGAGNCYTTGNVNGNNNVGGLMGYNAGQATNIAHSYATGTIRGNGDNIGGLVGYNYSASIRTSIAANDSIISSSNTNTINRISGNTTNPNGYYRNYALNTTIVQNSNGNVAITDGTSLAGTNVIWDTLHSLNFYTYAKYWYNISNESIWDMSYSSGIWKICDGKSLPFLRWQQNSCGDTLSIIATANGNGIISPSGIVAVMDENNQIFTFEANIGYAIDSLWVDGIYTPDSIVRGMEGSYSFEKVYENHTIDVRFAAGYTIAATAGENGYISPEGTIGVVSNKNQLFTFVPNKGYEIDSLWIDGIYTPDSILREKYTFNNITENHSIHATFKTLDFCGGDGSKNNPYLICNYRQLEYLSDSIYADNGDSTRGKHYKLMNDLDLSVYKNWKPIKNFQGNFDGNGKIIQNLTINYPWENNIGLFGSIYNAKIENLGVENDSIVGYSNVGGIVGYTNNSIVSNCYATGNVNGNSDWSAYSSNIGGLVGYNINSTISNCYATGNVAGKGSSAGICGGLVGSNNENSIITNCYAISRVTGYGSLGGLVGSNNGSSIISNCYASGNVIATYGGGFGGLAGSNSGTIRNCVAANDSVVAGANVRSISRIAGSTGGEYLNNYALNSMAVLYNNNSPEPITEGINTNAGKSEMRNTLQSLAFYTIDGNWDDSVWNINSSISIWKICDSHGLPFLRWQRISCGDIFSIVATAGNNGAINPSGIINIADANDQHFALLPDVGYVVDSLFIDGVKIPDSITGESYIFENVTGNRTINVTFTVAHTITVMTSNNGNISPSDITSVINNRDQTFHFWADAGYIVDSLLIDGVNVPDSIAGGSYTFKNVTRDHTIKVVFSVPIITAIASGNGSISPAGMVHVMYNTNQTFTFAANSGYGVSSLLIDGINVSDSISGGSYTFENVTQKHTIEVIIDTLYTITATAGGNGSISPAGMINVINNKSQTFVFAVDTSYEIDSLWIDGIYSPDSIFLERYTLHVTGNHSIHVTFKTIDFCGGNGTANNPYLICTHRQLEYLAHYVNAGNGNSTNGVYYKLMNNLDLSIYENWTPIGKSNISDQQFQGNLDGNNKIIQNLSINRPTEDYIGLFGGIKEAKIENLGIKNCEIIGRDRVGGLVGSSQDNSIISHCHVIGNIKGIGYSFVFIYGDVGALVGTNSGTLISNCYTMGNVNGYGYAGGLVGWNTSSSSITNCYATNKISCNTVGGGIVGYNLGTISNCYASGKISGGNIGGIVGYSSSGTIRNCVAANDTLSSSSWQAYRICGNTDGYASFYNNYAINDMKVINSHNSHSEGLNTLVGMGRPMDSLKSLAFYTTISNWNNNTWDINSATAAWQICEKRGLPLLRRQGIDCDTVPYTITATATIGGVLLPNGVINIIQNNNQTFTFLSNNDYEMDSLWIDGIYTPDSILNGSYTFINVTDFHSIHVDFKKNGGDGTRKYPYEIYTPQQLKDIADYVNAGNGDSTNGKYYKLMNDINLNEYVNWNPIGNYRTDDNNTRFQGNFNGNGNTIQNLTINRPGTNHIGLFGYIYNAKIENLGVENCNIIGQSSVGGLIGRIDSSTISNSYVTGNVNGISDYVGGLVGYTSSSSISNCHTESSVNGNNNYVGGLVGSNNSTTIYNCYTTGNISGSGDYVGGLMGLSISYYTGVYIIATTTSNCYTTGNVSGGGYVGGLTGRDTYAHISNCYATGNISGNGNHIGGLVGSIGSSISKVFNCYAVGNVKGNSHIGGLIGYNQGVINNCFAANDSVIGTSTNYINRIIGYVFSGSFQNNYALSTMAVKNSNGTVTITDGLNTQAGMSISWDSVQSLAFFNRTSNWNATAWDIDSVTAVWNICDGYGLPFLRWQGLNCVNTIIATADSNGTVSPSGTISVMYNATQTFIFSPNSGYVVDSLLIDGINVPDSIAGGSYTFHNVTKNHTIDVVFFTKTFITATAGSNGSISPSGIIKSPYNANQTFTFTADTGYAVDLLLIDGINVPDSIAGGSYTFNNVTGNHTIEVIFFERTLITATAGSNGSISPSGIIKLPYSANQTFTFTADTGYAVDSLLIDGVNVPDSIAGGSYTFHNVTKNHTIEVIFFARTLITATAGNNGNISPSDTIRVVYNENQSFNFLPNPYYEIDSLWIDGVYSPDSIAGGSYTFYNVTENHSIDVTFKMMGFCGGNGTKGNPYQICTEEQLKLLASYVNEGYGNTTSGVYYKLMNDIDLSGNGNWLPIGYYSGFNDIVYFQGNFDGNDKVVRNITIRRPLEESVGLFGRCLDATIENLGIENCDLDGGNYGGTYGGYVGGLAGAISNSTISNCYAAGSLVGSGSYVAGLVGYSNNSIIINCYTAGNVSGNSHVGGLVGFNNYHSTISNCYATGNVNGGNYVGGLVGYTYNYSNISNCYSTNNVYGTNGTVGGLVGRNMQYSTISNCYSTGNIKGDGHYVGGLVGYNYNRSVIRNCVAANDSVISTINTTYINRLTGGTSLSDTYYNYALNTMAIQNSNGNVSVTDGLYTRAGMSKIMDTFQDLLFYTTNRSWYNNTAWDIDSDIAIWKICDGNLPFLRWQRISCGNTHTITATARNNGSINPSGMISMLDEDNQNFTFLASNCYEIDSLWIDDIYAPDSITAGSYTFKNVAKNHTIEVSFKLNNFTTISDTICSDITYYFNGQNLTSSGIYYDTLQTTLGCDSIIELDLTVNPVYLTQIYVSICERDSFDFHSNLLTTVGTYYDTLQSIHSCDSIIELTLIVNPTYFTSKIDTICQGESYNFFGKLLTTSGIYYDTLQTIYGCDSVFELDLTVNPTYIFPDTIEICQGDNYLFRGKTYMTTGIYGDTLQTIHGCDSIFELNLTVNNTYFISVSESICGGNSYNFHGNLLTVPGIYYDTLQTINSCDSIIELTLIINSFYFTSKTDTICQGESYLFNGENYTTSGIYYDTLQSVHSCDSIIELTLTVNPTYIFPETIEICQGDSYLFRGKTYTTTGIYQDTLQAISGCDSIFELDLTVNPTYFMQISESICEGDSYNFHGDLLTTIGIYYDTLQAISGCDSVFELNLTVNPTYTIFETIEICQGDSYVFRGQTFTAAGIYWDTLQSASSCDTVFELDLTVNPTYFMQISESLCEGDSYNFHANLLTTSGIYYDTLQSILGCDSIIELTLTVNPLPEIPVINKNGNMLTSSSAHSYQWYLDNNTISGATEQSYSYTQNGIYFVEVTNEYGCSSRSEETNVTDVSIVDITKADKIKVYPNPTKGELIIENEALKIENIDIFDTFGKNVGTYPQNTKNETKIDISHLSTGIYFLRIQTNESVIVQKIIKQ